MNSSNLTLHITGVGDTKERALSDIFRQVASKAQEAAQGTCVRIEPLGFTVVKAIHRSSSERFLGLFFPRRRDLYEISACIDVAVKSVVADSITFIRLEERLTTTQHLIQLR